MKHSMLTIGFILIAVCFCLNLVNATGSEEKFKKTETESMVEAKLESKSKCENSCQICQKSVYQMKFQSMADCEGNGVCRDTCYKIKESWNTAWNPFEPFLKDVFGKCEICFRAGHCTISECKEQERNELEIINTVINRSHLTAKVSPDLPVFFPDAPEAKALPKIVKLNQKVESALHKDLKAAVAMGTTQNVIPKVQNLVSNYFDAPQSAVHGGVHKVLETGRQKQPSAANINYWTDSDAQGLMPVNNAKKVVKKLDNHLQQIKKTRESIVNGVHGKGKKKINKSVSRVVQKEQQALNKLVRKVNKLKTNLKKKKNSLEKLVNSPFTQDANTNATIKKSLEQVKNYETSMKDIKKQLKEDKANLKMKNSHH